MTTNKAILLDIEKREGPKGEYLRWVWALENNSGFASACTGTDKSKGACKTFSEALSKCKDDNMYITYFINDQGFRQVAFMSCNGEFPVVNIPK